MEIKELPISNERPECLSEKYDRYEFVKVTLGNAGEEIMLLK